MRLSASGAGLLAQSQSAIAPFELHRPSTLREADEILTADPSACIAAGCTDLTAQLREGRRPAHVVSVRRLGELQDVVKDNGGLALGAGLTHHAGSSHPVLREALPSLARAWSSIATVRIRYSATLGGNLLARRFRYEMPVILGALEARLEFLSGSGPASSVADLWTSDETDGGAAGAWAPAGLLTAVRVATDDLLWFGYERSHRPTTTVALAVRRGSDGGLRLTATVGSEYRRPFCISHDVVATHFAAVDPGDVGRAVAAQLPAAAADRGGSLEYRRHLVGVLLARLIGAAIEGGGRA
jgi:aerobic carbon-monoxide dehydrogenase medium subunit